jgi:hypothetical protein
MWFGFIVYELVVIFAEESKIFILLFGEMNYEIVKLAIMKFKAIISSKVDQILSKIAIIVFSVLMLFQLN